MKETGKRWLVFVVGIQCLAIGIICNTRTHLGVAAFSSVFYAISEIYGISLGKASIIMYAILIVIQMMLLRKVSLAIILQIPFSLAFGYITDLYDYLISYQPENLITAFLLLMTAFLFTSMGVYLTVQCNLVVTPVEGIVKTIAEVFSLNFSLVKNVFDVSMILVTVCFCLALHQPIMGIGIGTILSACFLGRLISIYEKKLVIFVKK